MSGATRFTRAPRSGGSMESNSTVQKLAAEVFGTGFLVFIGAGSVPATLAIGKANNVAFSMAELGIISFAFMLVIVAMVYTIGHVSGCHINPAVTVALAATGRFPWRSVPSYVAAQVVGATLGAVAIVFTLGKQAVDLGLGITTYANSTTFARATFAELIGTALLTFVIWGVIDGRAAAGWAGFSIGAIVFAIIVVVGPATGASLNPARYVGPMFVSQAWGTTPQWDQLPAYLIGEFLGGLLGALAYTSIARTRVTSVITSPVAAPVREEVAS